MRRNKFGNKKTEVDGIVFSSKREAGRYAELKLLERGRALSTLTLQPVFPLHVNGLKIGKYVGDFQYVEGDSVVVEDVKGVRTAVFNLKWKMVKALYPRIDWRLV